MFCSVCSVPSSLFYFMSFQLAKCSLYSINQKKERFSHCVWKLVHSVNMLATLFLYKNITRIQPDSSHLSGFLSCKDNHCRWIGLISAGWLRFIAMSWKSVCIYKVDSNYLQTFINLFGKFRVSLSLTLLSLSVCKNTPQSTMLCCSISVSQLALNWIDSATVITCKKPSNPR